MTKLEQLSGAWIFLSHSHKDLEKVRFIRNELERRGHNPLIFFLKCLEDDNAELPDLIRREIAARQWFILCKSSNSDKSRWVQEEIEMIQTLEDKSFEIVDLNSSLEKQLYKIAGLLKRATVFVSYSHSDEAIANRIINYLIKADYSVWQPEDIGTDMFLSDILNQGIEDAVQNGFMLLLLSESYIQSRWCRYDAITALNYAASYKRSNIIPVKISQIVDWGALPREFREFYCFDLTLGSFNERMDELIRALKTREMR